MEILFLLGLLAINLFILGKCFVHVTDYSEGLEE